MTAVRSTLAFPAPGPRERGLLVAFALAKIALHLTVITRYGWFRDELYYVACARHLAWGYVDQPPLSIAVLALVTRTLGESLVAIRIVPILAGAATVYMTGAIARELGGGRFAQALACLTALGSPVFLGIDHFYSMNALDLLLWTAAVRVLLACLRGGRDRDWMALGLVVGLGLLNKISMMWFGGALALGLIATPHRRVLTTRGPYLAAAIAGGMFAPHILWQIANGWPTLEFMRNATGLKMAPVSPIAFALRQGLEMGPGNAPVWLSGLVYALFARTARPARLFALLYLAVLVLLVASGRSRGSYLSVAYPVLLALGGLAFERASSTRPWRWIRPLVVILIASLGLAVLPMALPVLPVDSFIRYQAALGMAPSTEERTAVGPLPQHYADMFGWDDMVALVAKAYARLTPEERRRAVVFGQNYGEAGAADVLGRRLGLPRAIGRHNNYWLWGPGDWDGSVLIIIGGDAPDNAAVFDRVEIVGSTSSPYSMPYERGLDVSIGRGLKMPPADLWPRLRLFI